MSIIEFQEKNKQEVLELFNKVFHRKMTAQFWEWRFENNPFGKPLIKLAIDKGKIIGNYLLHPVTLDINNSETECLFSMTTMTDPEYAGRGIMTDLATRAYHEGKNKKFKFVYGFANKNSRYFFTKKLGFNELTIMSEMVKNYEEKNIDSKGEIIKIHQFDKSFDSLYERQRSTLPKIIVPRVSGYLNWRFIKNPSTNYCCYKIEDEGKLVGYFILKKYLKKCHIVDYIVENNEQYFASIIKTSFMFCKTRDCDKISLWTNRKSFFFEYLKTLGFNDNSIETYFVVKILNSNKHEHDYMNFDNWFITMSDSDVY